jgi:single-strand DNA-binding protein
MLKFQHRFLSSQLFGNSYISQFRNFTTKKEEKSKTTKSESKEAAPTFSQDNNASNLLGRERSLNLIQLIGRVGQDPRVGGMQLNKEKTEENEKNRRVVIFSVATNEYQGVDPNGVTKNRVDWHRVAVFSPRIQENVERYLRQGDRVYVSGRLHYNLFRDKAGEERYVTSILADDIVFLTKFA